MSDETQIYELLQRNRILLIEEILKNNIILKLLVKESFINENDYEKLHYNDELIVETPEVYDKKCDYFINLIAKNGLKMFQKLCYSIEGETTLVSALIDDSMNNGK